MRVIEKDLITFPLFATRHIIHKSYSKGYPNFFGLLYWDKLVNPGILEEIECQQPDYDLPEDSIITLPDWGEALFSVLNIIVIIFSLCGNIGALLVITKSTTSKRSTRAYLSLAICDLTLTLTSPTVDLSQLLSRYAGWIFGALLCKVIPFVQTVAVVGIGLFLAVIAIDRYLYIVRAFDKPSVLSKWKNLAPAVIIALIWIIAIGCALPNFWYYEQKSFWTYIEVNGTKIRPRNETCKMYYMCLRTTFDSLNISYYAVLGMAVLILTGCFTFCYVSIIVFVKKHEEMRETSGHIGMTKTKRNRKTLTLILGLILLNLVCRGSLWVFIVVTNVKEYPVTTLTLFLFYSFHFVSNVNSLINPLIYAIFNNSIRATNNTEITTGIKSKGPTGCGYCLKLIRNCFCCVNQMKSRDENNLEKSINKYDFTKQIKVISSISSHKFYLSDRNEFISPQQSSVC